jgi:FkbM family methyltransferase
MIKSFLQTWQFINKHPLALQRRSLAIANWLKWQVSSRILKLPVIYPWIGQSNLVVERGMTGATGNIYAGLHEFVDMAFCLHLLHSGDLFVDVGANIGSYTVLASKVAGANSVTLEPVPQTFERLKRNININEISSLVDARCCAVGATSSIIKFSNDCDTTNQAIGDEYKGTWIEVPVLSLDEILQTLKPTLIKIDVEGYEPKVIEGAKETLKSDSLLAILLETVNSEIENILKENGFIAAYYDPFTRKVSTSNANHVSSNYLWVKNIEQIIERCQVSPKYQALGINF